MTVDFFTPVKYATSTTFLENCLEKVDSFFDLGRDAAVVVPGKRAMIVPSSASQISAALRVAVCFTLILPLIFFVAKILLRLTHPVHLLDPQSHAKKMVILGNVPSLKKADVICCGETHTNVEHQRAWGAVINTHFSPEDTVLVETLTVSETGRARVHAQTRFANPEIEIRGWEPEDSSYGKEKIFAEFIRHQFSPKSKEILLELSFNRDPSRALKSLFEKTKEYLDLLIEDAQKKQKILESMNQCLKRVQELCHSQQFSVAKTLLLLYLRDDFYVKMLAYDFGYKEAAKIAKELPKRNHSLAGQIERYVQKGKRVFAIAGTFHFLVSPYFSNTGVEEVQKSLQKHSFVVLADKKTYLEVARFNPDLPAIGMCNFKV